MLWEDGTRYCFQGNLDLLESERRCECGKRMHMVQVYPAAGMFPTFLDSGDCPFISGF